MSRLGLLALACVCACSWCADDLTGEARAYLEKRSTPEADAKWTQWWSAKSAQMQKDFDLTEEGAADRYLTAWLRARADRFNGSAAEGAIPTATVAEKVLLCRFYLLYKAKGWAIPDSVSVHLTREKAKRVLEDNEKVGR